VNILVTGPTGTAGSQAVQVALADPDVGRVTALSRRPLAIRHPKLRTLLLEDFLDYSPVARDLANHDAALWCLGTSQNQVGRDEYVRITYEFTLAGAAAFQAANPRIAFCFLSGGGADSREKSRILFARVKGRTENALDRMGFERLHHFRPAYIRPAPEQPKKGLADRLLNGLSPLLRTVAPNSLVASRDLATAMLHVAKHGSPHHILNNREIRRVARAASTAR
jgi:uncharacterized protein YbjT (DUF2867 family)